MTISRSQTRIHRAYPGVPRAAVLEQPGANQAVVYSVQLENTAASASDLAILKGYNKNSSVILKDEALTPGASSISNLIREEQDVAIFEANNDAVYIGGKSPFGFIGIGLSTAGDGAATVTIEYWDGSAWQTLPTYASTLAGTTDYIYAVFPAHVEWEKGGTDLASNSLPDQDLYYVRLVATTTWPTTTPIANDLVVAEILTLKTDVPQNASLELSVIETNKPLDFESGEFLFAYFETASNLNSVEVSYSFSG